MTKRCLATYRLNSYDRVLQIGQEVTICLAHTVILLWIEPKQAGSTLGCRLVAMNLQLLFLSNALFALIEAVHTFLASTNTIRTNVATVPATLAMAIGLPIITVAISAAIEFDYFNAQFSCWINLDRQLSNVTQGLILVMSFISLGFAEAAGAHSDEKILPLQKVGNNMITLRSYTSLPFKILLNLLSFYLGSRAVFYLLAEFVTPALVINAILGCVILSSHALNNFKIQAYVKLMRKKLMC